MRSGHLVRDPLVRCVKLASAPWVDKFSTVHISPAWPSDVRHDLGVHRFERELAQRF